MLSKLHVVFFFCLLGGYRITRCMDRKKCVSLVRKKENFNLLARACVLTIEVRIIVRTRSNRVQLHDDRYFVRENKMKSVYIDNNHRNKLSDILFSLFIKNRKISLVIL